MTVEDEVRDPYLLEFLDLKDEYSESELEEALIRHLEWFLLELGAGFTFVARQKRIRIGDVWYRIDLLLYHRGLRCLVVIDLKTGEFTHADAGQMNLYLNYAKRHLMLPDEADPVGIILCSEKDDAVVEYAIGDIRAKVFASKYLTNLPDKETLRQEILNTQRALAAHTSGERERPMTKLAWKPWHQVVQLRDDLKTGELSLNQFAADLYEVMMQRGERPIYEKPAEFFALTYPTYNLRQLAREVVLRLAGQNDKAVRQLALTYGGGKTHTLITLSTWSTTRSTCPTFRPSTSSSPRSA